MLILKYHSHLVIYQRRKPISFYHLLATLTDQTCTHDADGDESNILLENLVTMEKSISTEPSDPTKME